MIIWDGMEIISLVLCGLIFLIFISLYIVVVIQDKLHNIRKNKRTKKGAKNEKIDF